MHMYFVLTGTVETLHEINICFHFWKKFRYLYVQILPLACSSERKNFRLPSFPFLLCRCFQLKCWLIEGSKKDYNRICWSFVFLRMLSLSFSFWNKFWFSTVRENGLALRSLWVSLNSHIHVATGILCARGITLHCTQMEWIGKENPCIVYSSSIHPHTPLGSTYKPQDQR